MPHPIWPLFDVEVRTPVLTLRYIDDALGVQLAQLAARGVHDTSSTPFLFPWTDAESPLLERETLRYYWRSRAETEPAKWNLNFAITIGDSVVGSTGLMATDFAALRQFETGSWLGLEHQGKGYGKELRRAMLALGFDGFGADRATTEAWHDNGPSLGVTESLGYTETGRRWAKRREVRDELVHFQMHRDQFDRIDTSDVELIGIQPVLDVLDINPLP